MTCAIWGTSARIAPTEGDYQIIDSPRAGGKYWISGTSIGLVSHLNDRSKTLLTTWICEQHRQGISEPQIYSTTIEMLNSRQPMQFTARFDAALRFLAANLPKLDSQVHLEFNSPDKILELFIAETECQDSRELISLLKLLNNTGYIDSQLYMGGGRYQAYCCRMAEARTNQCKQLQFIPSVCCYVVRWVN